jgi:hypothetical protein
MRGASALGGGGGTLELRFGVWPVSARYSSRTRSAASCRDAFAGERSMLSPTAFATPAPVTTIEPSSVTWMESGPRAR